MHGTEQMMLNYQQACADRDELREALQGVMTIIEEGILVRDTSHDLEPQWVIKQIPLVKALQQATKALGK